MKLINRIAASAAIIFLSFSFSTAQHHFRISMDFSIKEIHENGTKKLTMGRLYYDINKAQLIMDITFPEKEMLVFKDSSIYRISEGEVLEKNTIIEGFVNNTFYHLLLNNQLSHYGLKDSKFYYETKVEKKDDKIIREWQPGGGLENITGKIMTLNEKKRLSAIIFYNKEGRLLYKQNFNNYEYFSGLSIPVEVIQQYYSQTDAGIIELTKQYTYKNIILNEAINNELYDYRIPHHKPESTGPTNNERD